MREAIDMTAGDKFFKLVHILIESLCYTARLDLPGLTGAVQHLGLAAEVVDRAKHKIESIPVLFHPAQPDLGSNGIVVQFDSGENFNIRILFTEAVNYPKINAVNITVMIGEGDALNLFCPALVNPRLSKFDGVGAHIVPLRMRVVIADGKHKGLLSVLDELPLLRHLFNGFSPGRNGRRRYE